MPEVNRLNIWLDIRITTKILTVHLCVILTWLLGEVSSSVDVSSLESAESMIPPAHEGTQGSPSWYPLGPSVATR